ncbi:hypothetical protein ACFSLT_26490 [Novosphingobium resinovorum]
MGHRHGRLSGRRLPHPFREWNDKFRDDTRAFWRGDEGLVGDIAQRLIGSPVQFNHSDRGATSSINFLAAHDGFTLMDTVSFNDRHNEANGEGGADGHDNNLSDNMGAEGATDDEAITAARARRRRAMVATLMVSQGVPMLLSGDEIGNSQHGNNNVYCQDNELGWLDWESRDDAFLDFCSRMIALRRQYPVLCQENFLMGETGDNERLEIAWFQPDGRAMDGELWGQQGLRVLGMLLDYSTREVFLDGGRPLFTVVNAGDGLDFTLPEGEWVRLLDTARDDPFTEEPVDREAAAISPGSLCLFRPA